jgi:type II secretory pathway component PulJ
MSARSESGVTLVELVIGSSMLVVVLLATFASFDSFGIASRANFSQNQAQSIARTATDRMARELRSTGSPGLPSVPVERATSTDLIFDTVDPTGTSGGSNSTQVERVRYCLESPSNQQKIWKQIQTWSTSSLPSLPSTTSCPAPPFGSQAVAADYVVNQANSQNRPLFTYDAGALSDITTVTVDIYTDTDVTHAPGEQRLTTTIFLRNANRPPTAAFSATVTGSQHVLLNGSASSDPDGDDLTYRWYDGATLIGSGPLFDYPSPTTGSHAFSLTVTDSAGLTNTSAAQTVSVS